MSEPSFNQLLPLGRPPATARELITYEELAALAPTDRPYVVVNFVASFDGRVTIDGRSRALGDDGDLAIFHALREAADAVLAGTRTMQAENYGRMLSKAVRRERRVASGRSPEPLAVMISREHQFPSGIPLMQEPEARIVGFHAAVGRQRRQDPPAAQLTTHQIGHSDLTRGALQILRTEYDVRLLLCEGGATLFGALLTAGLVDELFLTLDPKLVGGEPSAGILTGVPEAPRPLEIKGLLERHGSLFSRLVIKPHAAA